MNRSRPLIAQLWQGELALRRVFWDYAIIYGTLLNLATSFAAFGIIAAGWPLLLAIVVFVLPLPYNLLIVVGVWRSAARYRGPIIWAKLARGAVVIWAILATAI